MINEKLSWARAQKGWTQSYLAEQLGVTPVTISRWEHGVQIPRAFYISRICHMLGMAADDLGFAQAITQKQQTSHTEQSRSIATGYDMNKKRREIITLLGLAGAALILPLPDLDWDALEGTLQKSTNMNKQVIIDLKKITNSYWHVFRASSSKSIVLDGVLGQIKMVTGFLNEDHPRAFHRTLCAIASNLAQLAGEIFFDLNDYSMAQSCYVFAAEAAKDARHYDLWASALVRHTYPLIYEKNYRAASQLLLGAQKAAAHGDTTLVTPHWVAAVQAEVHAGMQNLSACQEAFDRADQVRTVVKNGKNDTWLRFDDSRLEELRGSCYVHLEQPTLAIPALQRALEQLPTQGRRRGIVLTDLAQASLQLKKVEQACAYTLEALDLPSHASSGVLQKNIQSVRYNLTPFSNTSSVRQVEKRLQQIAN